MEKKLVRYTTGQVAVPRKDKLVAGQAKEIYDETRLAGFKVDGALALAGHIMEGVVELDNLRQSLTQGDQIQDLMLSQIQGNALRQVIKIQSGLYEGWGL